MEFDSLSGYSNIPAYAPSEQKTVESRPQASGEAPAAQETAVDSKAAHNKAVHKDKDIEFGVNYDELAKQVKDRNEQSNVSDMMEKAIEQANRKLVGTSREFSFAIHEKTRQVMVKVIDSATKETVREIPPQKALDALAKMWELAGILVDEKR